jgi:hypothetical protein
LLGTIGSIKFAATREYFADLRISENERATTEAIAESDKAKAESAKATLALAKLRAGRFLTPNGQRDLAQEMAPFKGLRVLVDTSPSSTDAASFAATLTQYLKAAGVDAHLDQSPPGHFAQLIG